MAHCLSYYGVNILRNRRITKWGAVKLGGRKVPNGRPEMINPELTEKELEKVSGGRGVRISIPVEPT